MSLGDIERRLRELEQQFQTLLEKATDDPAAVSYTHLDVYKRQHDAIGLTATSGVIITIPQRDGTRLDYESVSYTHLDVYKRQV